MKGYNQDVLKNQRVQLLAGEWLAKKLITEDDLNAITQKYTPLPYQPSWFVKIGLFFFTWVCISGGTLIFIPFTSLENSEKYISPLYGFILLFCLQYLIKDRKLHFSGIDNALLYTIPLCFLFQIIDLASLLGDAPWLIGLCYLPVLGLLIYFYGEPLLTLIAYLDFLYITAAISFEYPSGKVLLPFILFFLSILSWVLVRYLRKRDVSGYWSSALTLLHYASLSTAYLSINYGIVREGNMTLNGLQSPSPEIQFASMFWVLTFLITGLYLFFGYWLRKISFLSLGGVFLAVSLFTVHHYYPIISGEWAFTLAGSLGLGVSVFLIHSLKTPKNGFSYEPSEDSGIGLIAGTVISTQLGGLASETPEGPRFGEGDFGGGGAGQNY